MIDHLRDEVREHLMNGVEAVKNAPDRANEALEEATDSVLLRLRNRKNTHWKVALYCFGFLVAGFLMGNASQACI